MKSKAYKLDPRKVHRVELGYAYYSLLAGFVRCILLAVPGDYLIENGPKNPTGYLLVVVGVLVCLVCLRPLVDFTLRHRRAR